MRHTTRRHYDRGQDLAARTEKVCVGCGVTFSNDKRESPANWKRKKYCTRKCFCSNNKVQRTSGPRWTCIDHIILYEAYKAGGAVLAAKLLHRSQWAVKHRISVLGITPGKGKQRAIARRKAAGHVFFRPVDMPELDPMGIKRRTAAILAEKLAKLRSS